MPAPAGGRLRVVVFDGEGPGGALHQLVGALRAHGDDVVVRTPHQRLDAAEIGAGVSVAEPVIGTLSRLGPLLRIEGLPRGADVVIGYRDTVAIAERHRATTYPDATVVQLVDEVPRDKPMRDHLRQANLVIALNPETATGLRQNFGSHRLVPTLHEVADLNADLPAAVSGIRQAIHGLGERVPVPDDAWRQPISPREVVAAQAERDAPKRELASTYLGRDVRDVAPAPGQLRVMTVCDEYYSRAGGIPTVNRLIAEALAATGTPTYARVTLVQPDAPAVLSRELPSGVRVRGVWAVPGVVDGTGRMDTRAMSILPDNLPARMDVLVGHSRFSGGAAKVLQEQFYPDATRIHLLHTPPEMQDAIKGDPAQGLAHARTERELVVGAQIVSGIGPLLTREVSRLADEAGGGRPPLVHQIIPDMPAQRINPDPRPPGGRDFVIAVQGRAGDPVKRLELAAQVVRELNQNGIPTRLVVRGAPTEAVAREQALRLSAIADREVDVRAFVTDREELYRDLFEADLMLMPSIHEGFGMVASEAAQSGVPVLVGEGTGAGLFFGDPTVVDARLGEPVAVRDGNTIESLAERLSAAGVFADDLTAVQRGELASEVRDAVDRSRLPFWVEHTAEILENLRYHRERAMALRDHLDKTYPTGRLAHDLLDVIRRVRGD